MRMIYIIMGVSSTKDEVGLSALHGSCYYPSHFGFTYDKILYKTKNPIQLNEQGF